LVCPGRYCLELRSSAWFTSWMETLGVGSEERGPGPMPPLLTILRAFLARDRGGVQVPFGSRSLCEAAEPSMEPVDESMAKVLYVWR
jgi:hypothetical protein